MNPSKNIRASALVFIFLMKSILFLIASDNIKSKNAVDRLNYHNYRPRLISYIKKKQNSNLIDVFDFIRSLDEIHQNRHHSPSHYHDSHLEHQRSGDSDYEYSEDR